MNKAEPGTAEHCPASVIVEVTEYALRTRKEVCEILSHTQLEKTKAYKD